MKVKKKITKKKLKEPDEFLTLTEQAYIFITQHGKKVIAAVVVICVVVLAVLGFRWWNNRQEAEASQKFNVAVQLYQTVNSPSREATPAENKAVIEKFGEIAKIFSGTTSGKLSLLYEGNISLRMGDYDGAVKAYQAFLDKESKRKLYRVFALEGIGYSYEGKKDYQKAADAFQKIADLNDSSLSSDAYLGLGRCYEKLGKNKEALENYNAYLRTFPKSFMANAVSRKISQLTK
jgi:tetratricopeptide (TPR) repeat protein